MAIFYYESASVIQLCSKNENVWIIGDSDYPMNFVGTILQTSQVNVARKGGMCSEKWSKVLEFLGENVRLLCYMKSCLPLYFTIVI